MDVGLVLAAGASRRLGTPKGLVPVGPETAVVHVCRLLRSQRFDPIVVVGLHAKEIAASVGGLGRIVANDAWQRGRSGSVKAGVRAANPQANILVWPIDHPAVAASTLSALRGPDAIRVPVHEGRRGHPTWFSVSLRDELLALGDDQPLHDLLHARPARVREVPVDDPGTLLNIDTPDDLKKLQAFLGRSSDARPPA